MRLAAWLVVLLLALTLAPGVVGHGPHARIELTLFSEKAPNFRSCSIDFQPPLNTIYLMENFTRKGCISQWSWSSASPNIRCINLICSDAGWQLYQDGDRRLGYFWQHHFYANQTARFVFTDQDVLWEVYPFVDTVVENVT